CAWPWSSPSSAPSSPRCSRATAAWASRCSARRWPSAPPSSSRPLPSCRWRRSPSCSFSSISTRAWAAGDEAGGATQETSMTTRRGFLKTAAVATAALAARPGRAESQALTPVKVGAVVLGDFGVVTPTLAGIEKGYFKQNGLDAELIPFKGGPDLLKGVLS